MTKEEKLKTDWLVVHTTKDIPWTNDGADYQDSMCMFSPLTPPLDTEHNREIGYVKPKNINMSIRASQGHGKHETSVYNFCNLADIQAIYLHIKSELEKHNVLPE